MTRHPRMNQVASYWKRKDFAHHFKSRWIIIIKHFHTRLEEATIPDAVDSSPEGHISNKIPEDLVELKRRGCGSYLKFSTNRYAPRSILVSLNIDAVRQETRAHYQGQGRNSRADGLGLGGACSSMEQLCVGWRHKMGGKRHPELPL